MFWKRKGKRKGVDEAGGAGASSTATVEDSDDRPEEATTAEGDSDATVTGETDTTVDVSPEEPPSAGDADDAGKSASADDAEQAEEPEGTQPSDNAAEEKKSDKPAAEAKKKAAKSTKGGAKAASGSDATDEDVPEADSSDEDTGAASPAGSAEPDHAKAGTDDADADADGIQRVRTEGVLRAEGAEFEAVSNTWIVEVDDDGVVVIDPAHDAAAILDVVGKREIYLVACTNGYNTHVGAAIEVAERDEAPIALHRKELRSWRRVHGAERRPDHEIEGGGTLNVGEMEIDILPVPGTSSGSVAYYVAELGAVFSGDTLRRGELGTVGGGYVDYTGQLASVGEVLLGLPPDTRVLPDSGDETTVSAESGNFDSWVATR